MARILIVDDDPEVRNVCRTALEYAGFTVEGAGTGLKALEMVRDRAPDVVVCDLRLPGMSGTETIERLVAIAPTIRIIITSGDAGTLSDADDALDVFTVLMKPFRLAELVDAVYRELDVETH